ncbi:MAG: hypothetical protein HYY46_21990 [Deltaproteobacteria bacterium]|nr:hypothetical protein [Deltaproteobacteria bacterium]
MQAIENTIISRIYGNGRGWCFTPNDFLGLGTAEAVRIALFRLTLKKTIRRLANGLYDYPRTHPQLGLLSPDPNIVAQALARSRGIRIQPSGAYAANLLGLSEQVPARIVFLTDGAPRRIRVGNQEIVLRRTTPRNMATAGRISGTVIQALRYIGKDRITSAHRQSLLRRLSAGEKQQLIKDRLYAPGWMRPLLEEISEEARPHA